MQLGIRLHDTKPLPLEERLKDVKQQGFTCAHVALSKVISEFPVNPGALTPGLAMYLRKLFADCKLDFAVLGCYLNLAHPDKKELDQIIHTYLAHLRFASFLGCGVVGTETGAPNAAYDFEPACHSEEALQIFIRNLGTVVEYAENMGVVVAIEPVRRHIVYNPARARKVLDTIASPNLQIIFDPVNLLDTDNYMEQKQVTEEAIDLLGDDIAVIHMKDFRMKDGVMEQDAAGTGEFNYKPVIDFIKKRKPMIHCTLENTVPENAIAAKNYILSLYGQ